MIEKFPQAGDEDGHAKFQQWRREHPHGFFLNYKAGTLEMLHRSGCHHLGDTEHSRGDWGDLAKRVKRCSDDRSELVSQANSEIVQLQICADCKPTRR